MRFSRVLVVLKSYLGDAVMVAPLIDSLSSQTKELFVLAGGGVPDVLRGQSACIQFLKGRDTAKLSELRALVREVRGHGFDAVFLVNRSFRSALAMRLARIPVRAGHATEGRGFLLTHPVPYDPVKNEGECYNDLGRALGLNPTGNPTLCLSPAERVRGTELGLGATVAIQPGARYVEKRVPIDRWIELGRWLVARGEKVAIVGGHGEESTASSLAEALGGSAVDLVGKCSIRETMGVLSGLRLTAGSDTGVMHLAAGVGCPTLTVFGPNPATKWGHMYPPHGVIEAEAGDIRAVTTEDIVAAAESILGG